MCNATRFNYYVLSIYSTKKNTKRNDTRLFTVFNLYYFYRCVLSHSNAISQVHFYCYVLSPLFQTAQESITECQHITECQSVPLLLAL